MVDPPRDNAPAGNRGAVSDHHTVRTTNDTERGGHDEVIDRAIELVRDAFDGEGFEIDPEWDDWNYTRRHRWRLGICGCGRNTPCRQHPDPRKART